jgi:hypothetical protein
VPGSPDRPPAPDQPESRETPQQLRMALSRLDAAPFADRAASADPPASWSRADLRPRLERLPPGHPSSLQSSDHPAIAPDLPPRREAASDAPERSYWNEVPRFQNAWADHLRRWPDSERATAVDRSRDPEGSWRGDGNQYLDPEQHAQAKDVIAGVQQTEKSLTRDMTAAAQDNACGGWLEGMKFRLKGEDRLKEKIAEKVEHEPARTPAGVVRQISDAVRYTFCFEPANYSDGYRDVAQRLSALGYRMVYSKNHWRDDAEYKGINTRWVTAEGQRCEVQFHTAESFHAKQQVTHRSYERLRNSLTDDDERSELRAFQRDVCSRITIPEGAAAIVDYRREDRN